MLTPLIDGDPGEIGPYRITNRIGAGGMGTVFLGFDDEGKAAAVKVPFADRASDPQFRARFAREIESARLVRGRCVAQLLDADPEADRPWLATEFVEGSSLGDAVKSRGAVDARILGGLAVGLADALVAMHSVGVVHRDLKPSNVLLAWDGPKVIDFGIAKPENSVDFTTTGMLVGTLVWMAPEQLRGKRASTAADVFAWGACVAYAATGRPPFHAEGMHAVALQIINAEPDLDGVPEHLLPHVRATLAKDPAERPTATQLLGALVGRDVVSADEADSAARPALDTWLAAPPTSASTALLGAAGAAGAGREAAERTARDAAHSYGATTGSGGYPPPGGYLPPPGGSGNGAGRARVSTGAVVAAIALIAAAVGVAVALVLTAGDGDNGSPGGVTPTSTASSDQTTGPDSTQGSQPSSTPSDQPSGDGRSHTPRPDGSPTPSGTTSPTPTPSASKSATPEPTHSDEPSPTPSATTPAPSPTPTATNPGSTPTVPATLGPGAPRA